MNTPLAVNSRSDYSYQGVQEMSDNEQPVIEWITTVEAAAIMETTRANVTYLCRENKIRCEKFGRDWKVSKQDAEDYIKSARAGRKPND